MRSAIDIVRGAVTGAGPHPHVLFIAAHPEDETIGAGITISRLSRVTVVHVTDGSPRDSRFIAMKFTGTATEYAAVRAREVNAALTLAGVAEPSIHCLGYRDQEASHEMSSVAEQVGIVLDDLRPDVVVTVPYEGGHPDHDACAFAVHAAAAMRSVPIAEMALYHSHDGQMVAGRFLSDLDELIVDLGSYERALKTKMYDCFATQRDVLSQFPIGRERFRDAPAYDFSEPPHAGQLHYETLGWPMSGEVWRRLARQARSLQ
jgi:LmbE family N-acetylglucosaminyl deacetylase